MADKKEKPKETKRKSVEKKASIKKPPEKKTSAKKSPPKKDTLKKVVSRKPVEKKDTPVKEISEIAKRRQKKTAPTTRAPDRGSPDTSEKIDPRKIRFKCEVEFELRRNSSIVDKYHSYSVYVSFPKNNLRLCSTAFVSPKATRSEIILEAKKSLNLD